MEKEELDDFAHSIQYEYMQGYPMGSDLSQKGYLTALALETLENDEYDVQRVLREFAGNVNGLTKEERDEIVSIIEEADF